MAFSSDPLKQEQEVIFSRRLLCPKHPELYLPNVGIEKVKASKHLGLQ